MSLATLQQAIKRLIGTELVTTSRHLAYIGSLQKTSHYTANFNYLALSVRPARTFALEIIFWSMV